MATTRLKFLCTVGGPVTSTTAVLVPVPSGSAENAAVWSGIPEGSIILSQMGGISPPSLVVGNEYFIDVTDASSGP